ncbi:MAG: InlB B-repeat-containing protein [Paludibacteraceae bacterium]|nr:InlB B-repeat-containing protein [Paludibacteraceae bacterium]
MKKLFISAMTCALMLVPTITQAALKVEKLAEAAYKTSTFTYEPASGDARQGAAYNNTIYVKDKANKRIIRFNRSGSTISQNTLTDAANSQQGITTDDVGNLIYSYESGDFPANPGAVYIRKYNNPFGIYGSVSFSIGKSARCDYISASGDVCSASGGYVYYYCTGTKTIQVVKITYNGSAFSAAVQDTIGSSLTSGDTQSVLLSRTPFIANRRGSSWQNESGGTISLPADKNSTAGGCAFVIKNAAGTDQTIYAYNTGTNYYSNFKVVNASSSNAELGLVGSTTLNITGDSTEASGANANWLFKSRVNDYIYYINQYHPGGGVAYYEVYDDATTVTFNSNGGSAVSDKTVTYKNTYGTLPTPTKTGYTFNGWYKESGFTNQVTTSTTVASPANHTLYAKWTANTYTVTYDGNGATGGNTANSSHTYDVDKALTSNGFTKTGYTFSGWATSTSGAVVYTDGQSVTNLAEENGATVTLYAKWTANTYTVIYNANGGTGTMANSSHTYDVAKALTANAFAYGDYEFVGWSATANGEIEYTDGQSVNNLTTSGTITLYAKWATGYRLHSGTGTTAECYSNALSYTGYFSLYHKQGDALTMQRKDEHNNWINLPGNIDCSITNTVIKVKFTYATKVLGTISEYTGDFFVRTNPADGGLDRYPEPYMDNKMSLLTGTAKYYWAKYAYPTTEMKTIVGNLYNPNISATLCDGQILNDTSAMRVNYNRTTNEIKMYQAKDKIASIGANNATIDSLMKCTFVLPSFADDVITSTANVTGMQALSTAFSNTSLTGKRTRIVYDFATDSVFFSRLISSDETGDIDIANSNLVIEATDAVTPTVFNTFDIANGRVVYERTFSNNKIWYWISLPYSVRIADVQGMPHYGTAWIMQKYNTQARAILEGNRSTYWEYLSATDTLKAYEGYLLGFDNSYPMPSLLKFPSAYCSAKTTFNTTTSVTLPNYIGTHADKDFDANWHLVGSPLYSTSKVSGPEYIVTINATNTGYFYDRSSATTDLAPFTSFFVQYSGEENFTKQASAPSPAPLLQPKAMGDEEYYELVMTSPTYSEKTGIIMANDGSLNLYEQNKDLLMMGSWGKKYPQLYTCGASNKKMAFNHIAKATQTTLRVGIYVGQAETYTFSLSNKEVPAISVILRDKLLGIDTDLLLNDYTFNANTGYANSRFELIINRKADGTTGVLNTTDYAVQFTQNNGKLTISGVEPGTDIRLFDMAGRCIHQSKAQETTTLQSLPSGIYTAIVGTEAHKIVVK